MLAFPIKELNCFFLTLLFHRLSSPSPLPPTSAAVPSCEQEPGPPGAERPVPPTTPECTPRESRRHLAQGWFLSGFFPLDRKRKSADLYNRKLFYKKQPLQPTVTAPPEALQAGLRLRRVVLRFGAPEALGDGGEAGPHGEFQVAGVLERQGPAGSPVGKKGWGCIWKTGKKN